MLALHLSACTGETKIASSSSAGASGTGRPTSPVGSSGTTGSASGGVGSTTSGTIDAGCLVGSPSGLPEGSACLFPFDCDCGLVCGSNVSKSSGDLVCEYPCAIDSDCPLAGEHCQTTLGFCQGGLGGSCAANGSANLEFYSCFKNSDCPCPLECYGDPVLGAACELPCDSKTGCSEAGEICNLEAGSCQQSCNKAGLVTEFKACQQLTDCECPLSCFQDVRRGEVCELPCKVDSDCIGIDEFCETDGGSCQRTSDCFGAGGGLPAFSACVNLADCVCPLSCVGDPLLSPPDAGAAYKFCELCDGGSCQSISGSCQPQGDGGFQSSDVTPCNDNSQCTCPSRCVASAAFGVLRCEQLCTTGSDCDDPAQDCVDAQCVENYCDGQLACDLFDGRDDPPDAGNGTCLRLPPYSDYLCRSSGTASGVCDPQASRARASLLCPKDFSCVPNFDGGSSCALACAVNSDCGPGGICDTMVGLCASGNGTGLMCIDGVEPNDAGLCQLGECAPPSPPGALQSSGDVPCDQDDPCVCPNACIASTQTGSPICLQSCQLGADCADPTQTCVAGRCLDNDCSGSSLLCDLNGANSDGGQGTCLPSDHSVMGMVCTAPGTATGVCSLGVSRSLASQRCPLGFACLPVLDGGLGCLPVCVVSADCGSEAICVPSVVAGVSICLELDDAGTCALGQSSPPAFDACGSSGDVACGCSYACVVDQCEQTCQQDSDCLIPSDICLGTPEQSFCVPGGN